MLLGADCINNFLIEKAVYDGEVAWRTSLGWVLSGPASGAMISANPKIKINSIQTNLQVLWELDQPPKISHNQIPAFPLQKIDGKYEAGLLWKGQEKPTDNKSQALSALNALTKRFDTASQLDEYENVLIKEYLSLDAIELEPNPEEEGYYMPHHAVRRQDATTTKLRVVFMINASATLKGKKALNDVVDPGPSLMTSLIGLFLRFREFEHAFQADVRKAFFMIAIKEEDRPYLRFVWKNSNGETQIWRLKRLPFGVSCAPFILNAVLQVHLKEHEHLAQSDLDKELIALLRRSFYVDDCISSLPCLEETLHFKELSITCLKKAGMDLRKWKGNSDGIGDMVAGVGAEPEKVLGLNWDSRKDLIKLPVPRIALSRNQWTRRRLLKAVASVYDPLGLVSPVTIKGKMLLQDSWGEGQGWDSPFSANLQEATTAWWGDVSNLQSLQVKRWLGTKPGSSCSVHLFTDASEKAYGFCIYLVSSGEINLLFSKAKVAPLKRQTLARLELQAAFLGSTYLQIVVDELRIKIKEVNAWTDSLIVWHWLQRPAHHWCTFVANRVASIQEVNRQFNMKWRHCPSTSNPADMASRGGSTEQLQESNWFTAPSWILCQEKWPQVLTEAPPLSTEQQLEASKCRISVNSHICKQRWWERLSRWSRILGVARCMLSWKRGKSMSNNIWSC